MKENILDIVDKYLVIFPNERRRLFQLQKFLKEHADNQIIDWNNFDGHLTTGGFIYAKKEKKLLLLYHNDLKIYLYPGGHIDSTDKNILEAAKREIKEETGLINLKEIAVSTNELVPFDIDTHIIDYNERLKLPSHYHFDFRYLFIVNEINDINLDVDELSGYKWISVNELKTNKEFGNITKKIEKYINKMFD